MITAELAPSIGGVSADSLAERYGTPLYVYDANAVRAAFSRIDAAVPYRPRRIHYACVANANVALMQLIRSLGGGIHANTWGDAVMALHAGSPPSDIIYSGSNIGPEDMLNLFSSDIATNVNSLSQLRNYAAALRAFEERHDGSSSPPRRVGAIWPVLGWGCLAGLLRVVTATVNRSGMSPSTEARVSGLTGAVTQSSWASLPGCRTDSPQVRSPTASPHEA